MRALLVLCLAMAVFAGAGCGTSPAAEPATVKVMMSDYRFEPADIKLPAGEVRIQLTNVGQEPHDLSIADKSGIGIAKSDVLRSGSSGVLTVNLKAGTYVIYCGVAGHRERGMEGTLTAS